MKPPRESAPAFRLLGPGVDVFGCDGHQRLLGLGTAARDEIDRQTPMRRAFSDIAAAIS
jgi:hypothetical protein